MNNEFKKAQPVLERLHMHGYAAYFVGGSVRDYLLQKEVNDVDIATSATPEEVMSIFPRYVPLGIKHGTVMVLEDGESYEITTFRTEGEYLDFRRPASVIFVRSLVEDLKRRDFTMNAIAMTVTGEVVDLFQGKEAIANQEIKTVGVASDRFLEDALRMMRGIRFVSTLGFKIEKETAEAIKCHGHLLEHVSIERITVEFEKMLMGPFVTEALKKLVATNLWQALPNLEEAAEKLTSLSQLEIEKLQIKEERWALFLYVLQIEDGIGFLKKWKLPNKTINNILTIVQGVKDIEENGWNIYSLYELGGNQAFSVEEIRSVLHPLVREINVAALREQYDLLPIHHRYQLDVTGKDMLSWFEKPGGPWVDALLSRIERAVLEGKVSNEKNAIKEWTGLCNQK